MVLMRSTTSAEATCSRNASALSPNSGAMLPSARRSKSVNWGNGGQAGASASDPVIQPSRFGFGALIGKTYAGIRQESTTAHTTHAPRSGRSHSFAGQLADLLHPSGELS